MTTASVDSVLQLFSLISDCIAVIRVVHLRLVRAYPFFFLFLCIPLIPQTALVKYGSDSRLYFKIWEYVEPVRTVVYILVVWELFSVIFRNYAGLRSLSRWVMGAAAGIAPLGLVLTIIASESHLNYGPTRLIIRFERGIASGLVIFIVILLYFISRYPIKLPGNTIVHSMLYSLWFVGDAAILLISSYVPQSWGYRVCNDSLEVLEIGTYVGWAFLLSKTGEVHEMRVRRHLSPDRVQVLIGELDAMNDILVRAGHSVSHRRSGGS